MGRDVTSRAAIAAKVNEAIQFISGQVSNLDDPFVAG
jgi:hypothetical protein